MRQRSCICVCKHLTKEFLCVKRLSKVHNPLRSDIENELGTYLPCFFAKYNDKKANTVLYKQVLANVFVYDIDTR